jgi:hypothetical protein
VNKVTITVTADKWTVAAEVDGQVYERTAERTSSGSFQDAQAGDFYDDLGETSLADALEDLELMSVAQGLDALED